jgi:hypothetical protein
LFRIRNKATETGGKALPAATVCSLELDAERVAIPPAGD